MAKIDIPEARVVRGEMKRGEMPVAPGGLGAGSKSVPVVEKLAGHWLKSGKLKVKFLDKAREAVSYEWKGLPPKRWQKLNDRQMDALQRAARKLAQKNP